jgi:hypothetical protein
MAEQMKSGSKGSVTPTPANTPAKAGAACVKPMQPSGNTGSQGARPLKSGNKG